MTAAKPEGVFTAQRPFEEKGCTFAEHTQFGLVHRRAREDDKQSTTLP